MTAVMTMQLPDEKPVAVTFDLDDALGFKSKWTFSSARERERERSMNGVGKSVLFPRHLQAMWVPVHFNYLIEEGMHDMHHNLCAQHAHQFSTCFDNQSELLGHRYTQ